MPAFLCDPAAAYFAIFAGIMHIIIMPPQFIIIGMPAFIMLIMFWQHCMNMSFMEASIGVISQVMPFGVMVQVILHIIMGIAIPMPGAPIIVPIMGIMPFIIIGFMPPIMLVIIGIICIAVFIGNSILWRRNRFRLLLSAVGVSSYWLNIGMNLAFAFLQQVVRPSNTIDIFGVITEACPI